MCTVTVVRLDSGAVRLACNRDERHTRPAALPPEVRRFGRRRAVLPTDPAGGGTWVAATDAGLALTLLNVSPAPADRTGLSSRGIIIPALLDCDTRAEAAERVAALDAARYAPFRLLVIDGDEVAEVHSDGRHITIRREPLGAVRLWTSSSLGDGWVEGPRRRLFGEMVGPPGDRAAQQDAFHRHSWPEFPHLSVCMRRPDARTVSHCVVTLANRTVTFRYHPDAPDRPAEAVTLSLERPAE